jgi:hypothetical protein
MATTLPSRAELEKLKLPDLKKLCKQVCFDRPPLCDF